MTIGSTRRVPHGQQEMPTYPEHMISPRLSWRIYFISYNFLCFLSCPGLLIFLSNHLGTSLTLLNCSWRLVLINFQIHLSFVTMGLYATFYIYLYNGPQCSQTRGRTFSFVRRLRMITHNVANYPLEDYARVTAFKAVMFVHTNQ